MPPIRGQRDDLFESLSSCSKRIFALNNSRAFIRVARPAVVVRRKRRFQNT